MNRTAKLALILPTVALALSLAIAIALAAKAGDDPTTATRAVARDGATAASVEIGMEAGGLRLGPGAAGLMDGTFTFSDAALAPDIDYALDGGTGHLTVLQGGGPRFVPAADWSEVENAWDLRLAGDIPLALAVRLGAGESVLRLGGLELTDVAIETGAGATTVDFAGAWSRDVQATIDAGVGEVTIVLPRGVGVVVAANIGLGTVTAEGLTADGGRWVNDAYGVAPVTLAIDVTGHVGSVRLVLEPAS